MVSPVYSKIGGKVWKAKYTHLYVNFFSFPVNWKFIREDYYKRAVNTNLIGLGITE
jgi:hypothetical protein